MRPSDVVRALSGVYDCRQPVWLWGPPGVGKSACVKQAAEQMGLAFLDVRLVYHDPSDLKFPLVKGDELHWVCSLFPKDPEWRGIVCLEELPLAAKLMQAATMQVTLDGRVGEYQLPEGAFIVACGNRAEDRAGVGAVLTPVLNRFIHLDLDVSHEDWMAWAAGAGVPAEVRSFLNYRPSLLHDFDPARNQRAFPTPRSWEKVGKVLTCVGDDLLHAVCAGTVGDGAAAEFCGFLQIWKQLPDPDTVLEKPKQASVPSSPAVLYALCGALAERTRTADQPKLGRFVEYVQRLPKEFAVLAVLDSLRANAAGEGRKRLLSAPGMSAWMLKNKDLLGAAVRADS